MNLSGSFCAKYMCLNIIIFILGCIFLGVGCSNEKSHMCGYGRIEESTVESYDEPKEKTCSSGEASYYCYSASIKIKYDNTTCKINLGNYGTESDAWDAMEKYPLESELDVHVYHSSCYLLNNAGPLLYVGVGMLSFVGLSLILVFCSVIFHTLTNKINTNKTSVQKYPSFSSKKIDNSTITNKLIVCEIENP